MENLPVGLKIVAHILKSIPGNDWCQPFGRQYMASAQFVTNTLHEYQTGCIKAL